MGRGADAVALAKLGAEQVYGFETRRVDVETSREFAARSGVADRCTFIDPTADTDVVAGIRERVDLIFSIDAFEHYANPAAVLRGMFDLLRPGGRVIAWFGLPTWKHPYGAHLGHFNRLPWLHFAFAEDVIIKVRGRYVRDGATRLEETGDGLNRMTVERFLGFVAASAFELRSVCCRPIKHLTLLARWPVTREYFTSSVQAELVKPVLSGLGNAVTPSTRVSIGMPVYNGAAYIERALDSILAQTFTDFELIISDNASTDRTRDICERYAARDSRIRFFRNERNMGASWNFNRVYSLSRAPYFKQAAHDDLCAPTFLERCVEVLDRDPSVVMAYPRTILIDGDDREIERFAGTLDLRHKQPHERFQAFHHTFGDWSICHPIFGVMRVAPVANREILPPYIASDMVLLCELALHGKIYEVPEYLFSLRWHAGASTVANKPYAKRALWFDPKLANSIQIPLTYYRWLFEYLGMIAAVKMSPYERLRCYQQMPRWIYRHRTTLLRDAIDIGRHVARKAVNGTSHTAGATR